MAAVIDDCVRQVRRHFRRRAAKTAGDLVAAWKRERIYPFTEEPRCAVEQIEQRVFDIVAVNVARYLPDFNAASSSTQAFQLRMLKQAIERNPQELQTILSEALRLPKRQQDALAELLRDVSLSAIIGSAKVVADRLCFLRGLEAILFDPGPKQRLKERGQLHRIVAQNTWLFGEEFRLSVDDRSLTEVLRKHKEQLGEEVVIDAPVKHVSQERGIVDLMLSRSARRHRANTLSHLVVELKAPNVKLGRHEVSQIEGYAASVVADERFLNVDVRWQFWVVGDDLGQVAKFRVGRGDGEILRLDNVTIHLKTWAQILDENRARLQFHQEQLEYQADKAASLKYLQANYAEYLDGVLDPVDKDIGRSAHDACRAAGAQSA